MDKQHLAAEFARLAAALTEATCSKPSAIAEAQYIFAVFADRHRHDITAALTEWAQQDDIRRHALDEAEQACRVLARAALTQADTSAGDGARLLRHAAAEDTRCADAIARLKGQA